MSEIIRIDLNGVNSYLAKCKNGFILFDTGGPITLDRGFTDRRDILLKGLEAAGCAAGNLRLIVLTHGDCDHSYNAAFLRERFNTKIAMYYSDVVLIENPTLQKWMESFQYSSAEMRQMFLQYKDMITMLTQKALDGFERFTPDILLDDEFDFSPYGFGAKVIHTPGHTAGSVAILTDSGDLIAGDTLTNSGQPSPAPNATDFPQLSKNIERLKGMKINMIYPGHGEPFHFNEL